LIILTSVNNTYGGVALDFEIAQKAIEVINKIRYEEILWKPKKGKEHLNRRKGMGHIPETYTLDDYNNLIKSIVNDVDNQVYLYYKKIFKQRYFAFGDCKRNWEVIIGENGVMETAYEVVDMDYEKHFKKEGYHYLGTLEEVENFGGVNEKD